MSLYTAITSRNIEPRLPIEYMDIPRLDLRCLALSSHFERKLSRRFSLSDEVLSKSPISDDETQLPPPLLLELPYEVLLVIFDSINHAPSQISLALTCKTLAIVARDINLSLSLTSRKYAGFLPKSVFDVPDLMRQLTPWMPASLRLCNHCLTNRPRDETYWNSIAGCEIANFWIQKTGWTFRDASWHKQVHDICPACHATCSLSDYIDCDGCRALGRLGDVDWTRVSDSWRRRTEEELRAGRFAT